MMELNFTGQQIGFALEQAEADTAVEDVCRKMGMSQVTFYFWWKTYGGMTPFEVRRLKQLEV